MYSVCIYALLKVVGYYDLSVLSMSVMGFKKKLDGPRFFFGIFWNCFNFAKPHSHTMSETLELLVVRPVRNSFQFRQINQPQSSRHCKPIAHTTLRQIIHY